MSKEIWFRTDQEERLDTQTLRGSWRAPPIKSKNNNYKQGDLVLGRLYDGASQFFPKEYGLLITGVSNVRIRDIKPQDFVGTDMESQEDLKDKFSEYYGRQFDGSETVRRIEFDYT